MLVRGAQQSSPTCLAATGRAAARGRAAPRGCECFAAGAAFGDDLEVDCAAISAQPGGPGVIVGDDDAECGHGAFADGDSQCGTGAGASLYPLTPGPQAPEVIEQFDGLRFAALVALDRDLVVDAATP
jgi:hypothetical protein